MWSLLPFLLFPPQNRSPSQKLHPQPLCSRNTDADPRPMPLAASMTARRSPTSPGSSASTAVAPDPTPRCETRVIRRRRHGKASPACQGPIPKFQRRFATPVQCTQRLGHRHSLQPVCEGSPLPNRKTPKTTRGLRRGSKFSARPALDARFPRTGRAAARGARTDTTRTRAGQQP